MSDRGFIERLLDDDKLLKLAMDAQALGFSFFPDGDNIQLLKFTEEDVAAGFEDWYKEANKELWDIDRLKNLALRRLKSEDSEQHCRR
jgi:hypothetical protein